MAIILNRQITENEKDQIIARFGRKCYATGHEILETDEIHFDHIKAFINDGASEIDNIAPMCQTHNLQKGRLPLEDFRIKLRLDEFFKQGQALTLIVSQKIILILSNNISIIDQGKDSITNCLCLCLIQKLHFQL